MIAPLSTDRAAPMFSYLRYYLLPLAVLLPLALLEKGIFAAYHGGHFRELGTGQILHAIFWGIKFDLAICGALAFFAYLAAYLLQRLARRDFLRALQYTTLVAAATLLFLHGADMLYYGEAGRHLGYELKETLNSGADLATAAIQTYTIPVLLQLLLLLPLYLANRALFRLAERRLSPPSPPRWPMLPRLETALLLSLLISATLVRGGLGSVPLEPLHAQEIGDTRQATLALNGVYNAIFSSVTPYSISPVFNTPPQQRELDLVRQMFPRQETVQTGDERRFNIVMLLLESWSGTFMQPYGFDKQTTPFFDELRQRSLTTLATVAGGHRTTEGMFATLCSWQNPLGQTVAQSQLQNYSYRCLPQLLHERGYHTAFFQGTLKNTSGTGAFAQSLGFRHSYGKKDVANHRYPHNSWGLQDPDLYRFVIRQMKQMPQPFFVGINTNSTHSSELPPGVPPRYAGNDHATTYINMLHFSDAALRAFIEEVEHDPAFSNTLFVLVADHAGPSRGKGVLDKYLIPFLIYAPGIVEPRQLDLTSGQRDIAPTLLDLLQIAEPTSFTGTSLLADDPRPYVDYYHQGRLGWIEGTSGVEFRLDKPDALTCTQLDGPPLKRQPVACAAPHRHQQERALAFTHLSQTLLFSGRTADYPTRLQEYPSLE